MPAWICHNVKTAAKVAGKRILYIDLAKNSINATCAQYDEVAQPGRILLIAHLFGVPTDVGAICELARRRDCVTIEDAVPAIGGRQEGRLLGTFADFGVFSFEQSKRIPAFRGGFIVAKSKHVIDLSRLDSTRVVQTTRSMPFGALAEALFHNFVTHPLIYRHLIRPLLPLRPLLRQRLNSVARKSTSPGPVQGDASAKPPSTPFYTREIHPYQAQLLIPMIRRIDRICKRISQLAELYEKHFEGRAIQTFIPVGSDTSGLMRFPIAFPGRDRSRILRLAQRRGIYLKTMWSQEAGCEGLPNCLWVARNLILLPLYSALSLTSAEAIAETLLDIELTSRSECQTTE
jgi:dTDP-4-amino-4,6-dideoxygalactose transaminase